MDTGPKHMRRVEGSRQESVSTGARVVQLALLIVASCVVALAICFVAGHVRGSFSSGGWFNRFWFAFFAVTCFLGGMFVVCRDWLATKPERLYLVVVLCVTALFSWSFSVREVGWDVGVHYRNIARIADWEGPVETSSSDQAIITTEPFEVDDGRMLAAIDAREDALDVRDGQEAGTIERPKSPLTYLTGIEYVPYALVMAACGALGFSFSRTLLLMRLTGGLFYSVVTYLGMRKLRGGKMLYAVIALLPTSVFLAAELGYSYWLLSLCLYGFASLVGMMQGSVKVGAASLLRMLGALFVGMLPRVVYFPLMFLCLLIPDARFPSRRFARAYRAVIVVSALAALGVWLVPRLMSGMGTGDARGGEVDPGAQVAYILSHPLEYAQTFVRFVLPPLAMEGGAPDVEGHNLVSGFLSVEASPGLLTSYGYLPRAPWPFTAVIWALLALMTLTDKDSEQQLGIVPGVVSFILCSGVFVMIVTALYFEFTPVGLAEIHGVQRRYLLPMIYPLLAFVGPSRWGLMGERPRVSALWYNCAILVCMVVVLLGSFWCSCVSAIV